MSNPTQDAAAKRRARQTVINLILALAATLGIVLVIVAAVPRDNKSLLQAVDYKSVVSDIKKATGIDVPAPTELPKGWWVNAARFNDQPSDGVKTWHIGFVGPKNQYVGFDEGFAANQTWLVQQTKDYLANNDGHPIGRELGLQSYTGQTAATQGQTIWVYTQVAMANEVANGSSTNFIIVNATASKAEVAQFANLLGFGFN